MPHQPQSEPVKFYVEFFNLSKFKTDKRKLNSIVSEHVRPTSNLDVTLSVVPYYKPNKISSQFSTRVRAENTDRVNVVYSFSCSEDACNASYIGYTSQTLVNRIRQHKYQSSSICKHYMCEHNRLPPAMSQFSQCFEIVYSSEYVKTLKIVEAILIKSKNPPINVKYNELYDFLQLY